METAVIVTISIIAVICFGWIMWLLPEYKKLSTKNKTLSTKNETLSTENKTLSTENGTLSTENQTLSTENGTLSAENQTLSTENETLSIENKTLKTDLDTSEKEKSEVSESNANAVWRLHLAQVSLEASAVAFYVERTKSDQLTGVSQDLTKKYGELYDEHKDLIEEYKGLIEESNQRAEERLARSGIKLVANFVPFLGAVIEVGEVIESLADTGEALIESSDMLSAFGNTMGNLEIPRAFPVSMETPIDADIDDTPIALTEEVQSAYTGAFDQYLMESEKLDISNLRDFSTEAIQRTENAEALKSLAEDARNAAIGNFCESLKDFRIEYYEYHQTQKLEPPENSKDSDKNETLG
jgi:regulator of replication initiation timing